MNDNYPFVAVLMSTYNGEKYLKEQIDSILCQQKVRIFLMIRDDGSTDSTINILSEYSKKYDNVVFFVGDNVGPSNSFLDLIHHVKKYDYYAFADQDDVWDEDKIYSGIKKLKTIDNNSIPVMYYSNLKIVDENLNFYRLSHSKERNLKNKYGSIVNNLATGCTIIFNNYTVEFIKKYEIKNCAMHDALLFMICSIFGKTVYDFDAHINYRQHSNNVVGTYLKRKTIKTFINKFKSLFNKKKQPRFKNAIALYESIANYINGKDKEKLIKICNYKKSIFSKFKLIHDKEIMSNGFMINLRYKILIILGIV